MEALNVNKLKQIRKVKVDKLKNTSKKGSSVNTATPIKLGNTKYNPVSLEEAINTVVDNLDLYLSE